MVVPGRSVQDRLPDKKTPGCPGAWGLKGICPNDPAGEAAAAAAFGSCGMRWEAPPKLAAVLGRPDAVPTPPVFCADNPPACCMAARGEIPGENELGGIAAGTDPGEASPCWMVPYPPISIPNSSEEADALLIPLISKSPSPNPPYPALTLPPIPTFTLTHAYFVTASTFI